ncbi:MAG: hypothetical protein FWG25_10885, partial [Promicromonosporaceae bacterium]|nr:hypothetical protein [Promicromonosporaceae bacterium]
MALTRNVVGASADNIFTSDKFELNPSIIEPWLRQLQDRSVVAALAPQINLPFGDSEWFTFHDHEAQYVGEGQPKLGSPIEVKSGMVRSYKFQKTVRFTDEALLYDRERQIGLMADILTDMVGAIGRALDYGVIHAIDPRSGQNVPRMDPALHDAPRDVDITGQPVYSGIDGAVQALLTRNYSPNGIALDRKFAAAFATAREGAIRLY